MKYKVEVPDLEYWKKMIKCQYACPVKTDARGYVIAIAEGRYEDAYRIAREPNPFASICGRVCGAPCEVKCRKGDIDWAVSIRALKRFVTEKYGVEAAFHPRETLKYAKMPDGPRNTDPNAKVAIIGSGVGGLTAAHDLGLLTGAYRAL